MEEGQRLRREGHPAAALDVFRSILGQGARDNRERSRLWFQIGESFSSLDDPSEAFLAYNRALETDSANDLARLRLGELYLQGGSLDRASEQAQRVIQDSGANADAFELLGTAAAAENNVGIATESFRRVLQLDPRRLKVAISLAELLNHDGKGPEAREVLHNAAKAQPESATPYLGLGHLAEEDAQLEEAERAYRKAIEKENTPETNLRLAQFLQRAARMEEAESILEAVDAARPNALPLAADFKLKADLPVKAAQGYAARLSANPEDPKDKDRLMRTQLISRLIEADIQAVQQSEPVQAPLFMRNAREHLAAYGRELDEATRHLLLAELELAGGDLTIAASEIGKAAELAPNSASLHYLAGVLRQRLNDAQGAIAEWRVALQARSDFIPARIALAEAMLREGDFNFALELIVPVIRVEPANLRALVVFCRTLREHESYAAAQVICKRIEALDKGSALPNLLRGEIALADHQPGAALIFYEQAIIIDPQSEEAMQGLMQVYKEGSITRPVLLRMEEIASGNQGPASLMELVGRLYAERGWTTDAIRCLRRAAEMDPSRNSVSEAIAKLLARDGKTTAATESAARMRELSNVIAGMDAQDRNDLSEAVRHYEEAVRSGDSSGVSANNLAWIYARQGRELDRALILANHARQLSPADPAVLDTVGVVHLARREYSAAIKVLELARKLSRAPEQAGANPQQKRPSTERNVTAEIKHHLAEAYLRAGETERAALLASNRENTRDSQTSE